MAKPKVQFQINFTPAEYDRLEEIARKYGVTKTDLIKTAVGNFIETGGYKTILRIKEGGRS